MRRFIVPLVGSLLVAAGLIAGVGGANATPREQAKKQPSYDVFSTDYDLGATAFRPKGFPGPVELQGRVHSPVSPAGKRFPMVILLHGRHGTCATAGGEELLEWPCRKGAKSIPSLEGYDYFAASLAKRGMIVVSIGANGINAVDENAQDSGMRARGELVQKHLDLWRLWSTGQVGPFKKTFKNAIDFQRIGTLGHSRGGEGIVAQLEVNKERGNPYGIKAVLPLAPTDFTRRVPSNVPLGVVLPACDGDVFDLQGQKFYDDARYAVEGDPAPKHVLTMRGANHNFFNTVWSPSSGQAGAVDDWSYVQDEGGVCKPGSDIRLSEKRQRSVGATYINAFFQLYLNKESAFAPLWQGEQPPPQEYARTLVGYQAPAGERLDVNRLTSTEELTKNTLGGEVRRTRLDSTEFCSGPKPQPPDCLEGEYDGQGYLEPHASAPGDPPGTSILETAWTGKGAGFSNEIPAGRRKLDRFDELRFRGAWDFSDPRNALGPRKVRVEIVDGAGRVASVDPSRFGDALAMPEVLTRYEGLDFRRYHLQQVRVPMSAFDGVDLSDVRWVRIAYGDTRPGVLALSDLSFT